MEAWNFRGNGDFIYPLVFPSKWGKKNRGSVTNFWTTKGTEEKSRYYKLSTQGTKGTKVLSTQTASNFCGNGDFVYPRKIFPDCNVFLQ